MTRTGMFFSEFIASALLMFLIYALKDEGNIGAGPLTPLGLFFIIFGIGACFGWETGYAINLARDFGPRLVSYMIGYGHEVWSAGGYYFWVSFISEVPTGKDRNLLCLDQTTSRLSANMLYRYPWSRLFLDVLLVASFTTPSYLQESRLSTRRLWV